MTFTETKFPGVFIIELQRFEDERGFFAHSWSKSQFAERGLDSRLVECGISFNWKRGTLRGMHYQVAPQAQVKIVRCTRGSVYDVIIDLRADSATFKQWIGVELTGENHNMLYIPKGFAHGFQTLEDASEVFYQMSEVYAPESGRGVRWNDPAFKIAWPEPVTMINERDRTYPDVNPDAPS
jgi:dTDP-4-dehydrorhamnose 3,5-epimerase